MLGGQHGIARAQVTRGANPLPDVEIRRIVGARRHVTSFVIVPGEGVHAEVKRNAELQFFKFVQRASAIRSRFDADGGGGSDAAQ